MREVFPASDDGPFLLPRFDGLLLRGVVGRRVAIGWYHDAGGDGGVQVVIMEDDA